MRFAYAWRRQSSNPNTSRTGAPKQSAMRAIEAAGPAASPAASSVAARVR